jgi:hypothetical protein
MLEDAAWYFGINKQTTHREGDCLLMGEKMI